MSCGGGTQRIKWLGHVGIARYDEKDLQGWRTLGRPLHNQFSWGPRLTSRRL